MDFNYKDIIEKIVFHEDEKAFGQFFDRFYPKLFSFSLQYVHYPVYAEEVVSNVFYKLLKNKNKLLSIKNVNYYLFTSVKNQSLTFLRDQKRKHNVEPLQHVDDYIIPCGNTPETGLLDREIQQLFNEAVDNLSPQRKTIFRLIREEGLRYEEVADLLKISPRTVETHLGLAIKSLCKLLVRHIEDQKANARIRKILPGLILSIL